MKKTILFLIILALLVLMGMTGLAWAQVQMQQIQPIPKTVFISSQAYVANLAGVAGADQLCQRLATAAGLSGTYKAWLSDVNNGTPVSRWSPSFGPYRLRNGVTVANSWNEIVTTGKLLKSIYIDEYGRAPAQPPHDPFGSYHVWTGTAASTRADGSIELRPSARDCGRWFASDYYVRSVDLTAGGSFGIAQFYNSTGWVSNDPTLLSCSQPVGHLYCFQQ